MIVFVVIINCIYWINIMPRLVEWLMYHQLISLALKLMGQSPFENKDQVLLWAHATIQEGNKINIQHDHHKFFFFLQYRFHEMMVAWKTLIYHKNIKKWQIAYAKSLPSITCIHIHNVPNTRPVYSKLPKVNTRYHLYPRVWVLLYAFWTVTVHHELSG